MVERLSEAMVALALGFSFERELKILRIRFERAPKTETDTGHYRSATETVTMLEPCHSVLRVGTGQRLYSDTE